MSLYYAILNKPWNKQAITAEFGQVSTEGSDDHLAFLYILQNNTAEDLRLDSDAGISITAKLKGKGEFATFSQRIFTVTYPIFVPAKSRVRLDIQCKCKYELGKELNHPLSAKPEFWPLLYLGPGALETALERGRDESVLALFVADTLPNLDGFVLFDSFNRYEIEFQSGWEKRVAEIKSCVERDMPEQACETDPGTTLDTSESPTAH